MSEEKMATGLESNMTWLNKKLKADQNFDVVYRVIHVGGKNACIYFIDGFCKDELMQKLLQQFMGITAEDMPKDAHEMAKSFVPYVEVDLKDSWEEILYSLMSGVFALFVDGFDKCILIDSRTIPPGEWRSRRRIRCSEAPRTALWKPLFSIPRLSGAASVPPSW